ncbi:MAG: hypothetical protein OXC62_02605 [Aestuariivita sp.]|nr:hypothetical protein [Aestuariivita sp.]
MSRHASPTPDAAAAAAAEHIAWIQWCAVLDDMSDAADRIDRNDYDDWRRDYDDDWRLDDDTGDSYRGEPEPRPGAPVTIAEITDAYGRGRRRYVSAPGGPLLLDRSTLGRWGQRGVKPLLLTADDSGLTIPLVEGALLDVSVITADMLDDVAADGCIIPGRLDTPGRPL